MFGNVGEHPETEFGTFRWQSGNSYIGDLKWGLKDGKGTFTWATGAIYEGYWKDDKRNGQGSYKTATTAVCTS